MLQRLFLLFIICTLCACSTTQLKVSDTEENTLKTEARESKKSASELLTHYKNKLDTFNVDSLLFYSPLYTTSAELNVKKAKKLLLASTQENETLAKYHLITALRNIDYSTKNKMAVKLHLKKSDTHYAELKKLKAQQYFPEKFENITLQFKDLINLIELGDTQKAIGLEDSLIETMLELEISTLNRIYLDEAKSLVKRSISLNAEDYAPSSLQETELAITNTEQLIKTAFRNRNGILENSRMAEKLATKLFYVTQTAYKLHSSSYIEIEKQILHDYKFIDDINSIIDVNSSTIESYPVEQEKIISALKSIKTAQTKNLALEQCEAQRELLTSEVKKLEQNALYQKRTIISEETNKAVLPELLLLNSYSDEIEFEDID